MLIPDNLRQEDMPMMVYALCKAVKNGNYSEDELIKYISVSENYKDDSSANIVRVVLNFAQKAGFIQNENSKNLITEFNETELESPLAFSQSLLKRLEMDNSKLFSEALKWFLWKGPLVEGLETHKDVKREMDEDSLLKQYNISEDFVHGFLFWIEFLGIATHTIGAMGCYNYSIENILIAYLNNNADKYKKYGNMPAKDFFEMLGEDIFFIKLCCANTTVCDSLSIALRIIEKLNIVELEDKNDGSMTWHLQKSNTFKVGNSFTNVKVR